MPKVTVRAFASLRDLLGSKVLDVDAQVQDVGALINLVADRYQSRFIEAMIDPATSQVRKGFTVLVNGREIAFLKGLGTELRDGDTVSFFPPVGGG